MAGVTSLLPILYLCPLGRHLWSSRAPRPSVEVAVREQGLIQRRRCPDCAQGLATHARVAFGPADGDSERLEVRGVPEPGPTGRSPQDGVF